VVNILVSNTMPRIKIAILGDALDGQYAGVHYYLMQLVDALEKVNTEHQILLFRPKHDKKLKNITQVKVPLHSFPGSQIYRFFYQLPNAVKKYDPDIVIEPGHFGPFNLPTKIKRVTIIHDLTPLLFPKMHRWHSQILQKLFLPSILKKAELVLTNSKYTTKDVEGYFPLTKGKLHEVIPGSDPFFKKTVKPEILEKYKLKPPYLLFIGTIEPRKNLPLLIKAFNLLKKEGFDHQLVIVGKKGWHYEASMAAIENSPFKKDIHLPGYIDREDLPVIYSMAEQFIYPSLYEGFGLPVLEAMCCETPVVTTNISSLPEVGGDAAFYFDNNNTQQLFKQIKALASSSALRTIQIEKGIEQSKNFNWKKSAINLLTRLEELINSEN